MLRSTSRAILGITCFFLLVLVVIRGNALNHGYFAILKSPGLAGRIAFGAFYDVAFAIGLSAIFLICCFWLKSRPGILKHMSTLYSAIVVLLIFVALVNVKNIAMLGGPFNYQWLYYSDFLDNSDSKKAIAANLTKRLLLDFVAFSLLTISCGLVLGKALKRVHGFRYKKHVFAVFAILMVGYFLSAKYYINRSDFSYSHIANPVIAFSESVIKVLSDDQPDLFTMDIPKDFEPFDQRELVRKTSYKGVDNSIENVLLFVLESVPVDYVAGYPGNIKVTPVIEDNLSRGMVFSDIYAHVPATNNSLVSILSSLYPMISYKSITHEYPNIHWPDLSAELKKRNYHTNFLHASDNRFQKVDTFLSYRQYDEVHDYKTIPCERDTFIGSTEEWKHLDGVDEECMGAAFIKWMDQRKDDGPFFATLWTMQTHYPYFVSGEEKDYQVGDPVFNRYLNALNHSDDVLGKIISDLEKRELMESTLIVIVGDHGEAFGQHEQFGHAVHVYEENIKVPLIFINPALFSGQTKEIIGGHIDIAPSIMDVLNLEPPKEWQGISLFNEEHPNRTFFFNPYSGYLFGYRIDSRKVIYDAALDEIMVFDLKDDPEEKINIAKQIPGFVDTSKVRLAQWVQYHSKTMEKILEE
ncbi:sulfatase-like hydrolase/transferase [Cytophagaceae bacterium ABcell3]|nr:sulfatase-like hydrolase/transferase [Cytophagaceae bacterium ABcell3]